MGYRIRLVDLLRSRLSTWVHKTVGSVTGKTVEDGERKGSEEVSKDRSGSPENSLVDTGTGLWRDVTRYGSHAKG